MASIAISASLPRACTSQHHVSKKKQHAHQAKPAYSSMMKNLTPEVRTVEVRDRDSFGDAERRGKLALGKDKLEEATDVWNHGGCGSHSERFTDERWKNGTWDLNMFVKNGKMDWEGVIVAEAKRRKFLELYPEAATNQ